MDTIPEIIGYVALAITLVSFSMPEDDKLQKLNLAGCTLWAAHFCMLMEWSAFIMLLLACAMVASSILGLKRVTNVAWILNILLIPVMASMIISGGAGWLSILPVIGGFFINTGVAKCRGYGMTITIAMGHITWMIATLAMGSIPAFASNALSLVALIWREIARKKSNSQSKQLVDSNT